MERVEVIDEKNMVKRLFSKFFGNIFLYGLLYIACMIIFLMFIIFQEETLKSMLTMSLVSAAINLLFIMMIINSSISSTFNGINTVNVPEQSRQRILSIVGTILMVVMIVFTIVNIIIFQALFQTQVETNSYTVTSEKTIDEVIFDTIKTEKTLVSVNKVSDNKYLITSTTYSKDATMTMVIIIALNILILIGVVSYENSVLKKHLVT